MAAMVNSVLIEGLVRHFEEKTLASGTRVIVLSLEHQRLARGDKIHTPWFWVFFIGSMYDLGKRDLAPGVRVKIGGTLDTTSFMDADKKIRRTYINARELEVVRG